MLEELFNLVKEQAQGAIINNDAVPNEHNDAAIQEITNAIHSGLSEHLSGDNLEGILQMFQGLGGDVSGHPMVQGIISNAASSLAPPPSASASNLGKSALALFSSTPELPDRSVGPAFLLYGAINSGCDAHKRATLSQKPPRILRVQSDSNAS